VVAGLAGVSLYVVSPKTLSVEKRCTMLAVLSIAGAFVATVLFATRFSVADGRYLHVVLLPFCFILAIGLMALLKRIFPKHWEQSALLAFLGMLVLGHLITWGYQGYRLIPCASATKHNVDAGVEILPIDLTGDRVDEIVMYHRARTRAFVYRWQDGVFKLIPRWTRVAGAAADLMYAKDVKLNGKEDLLFYRPSNERLSVVQAKEFSCPDCSLPLEGDSETMISEMNKALPEIKRWYEGQSERMEIGFSQLKQISPDLAKLIENEREHLQVIEASLSSEKAWLVFNKSTAQLTVVNCSATLPESPSCEIKSQGLWRP
jgi:hypothetical protein